MKRQLPLLLLQPPGSCREFTRSGSCYPPLGLCQLAAMVDESDVFILDADGLQLSKEETIERICEINPIAIGMTLTTYTFDMISEYSKPLCDLGFKIIIGGPQASLDPKGTIEKLPSCDWVFCGEAELQMREIINGIKENDLSGIKGICFEQNGELIISEKVIVENLGEIPFPTFDGLPIEAYWCPDAINRPMLNFMTTRGCPHRCGFCSSPALLGRKLRRWSTGKVVDEIEYLVNKFGIKEFSFVDDVFTIDKNRLNRICELIIEKKLDITWFCNSRADQINEETAILSAKAGCHQMYLGFESGHEKIIKLINKDTTIERLEEGAEILRKAGIGRSIGFVIGLPGENEETIQATIDIVNRVKPERVQFTRWTPLVASPLFDQAKCRDSTFHNGGSDEVSGWISKLYDSVKDKEWGAASW